MTDISQWFRTVDKDNSGHVNASELQKALAMGQLHFSLTTTAHMIRLHDTDKSGTISLQEFNSLHQFLMTMNQSYMHFDQDRSGSLSQGETYQALQHAGFTLDKPAFEALFSAYDPDRNLTLGMAEFIALTLFLKSSASMFGAFDSARTGRVNLDYNQFIYAAANCR